VAAASQYRRQLQKSLLDEVERLAAEAVTTIDQFINMAVAEKAAALRTAACTRSLPRSETVQVFVDQGDSRFQGRMGKA
jgi:hypothetical protein